MQIWSLFCALCESLSFFHMSPHMWSRLLTALSTKTEIIVFITDRDYCSYSANSTPNRHTQTDLCLCHWPSLTIIYIVNQTHHASLFSSYLSKSFVCMHLFLCAYSLTRFSSFFQEALLVLVIPRRNIHVLRK